MTSRRLRPVLALLLLCVHAPDAWADPGSAWRVDPTASAIVVEATQMGGAFEGAFRRFNAEVRFDPDRLDASRVSVTIETGSLDTGNDQRDQIARGGEWFDVAQYPTARFEAERFVALGDGGYRAEGTLAIKGVVRPVTLPFDLAVTGNRASVAARLEVQRTDYDLGTGEWASNGAVGTAVVIRIRVTAYR